MNKFIRREQLRQITGDFNICNVATGRGTIITCALLFLDNILGGILEYGDNWKCSGYKSPQGIMKHLDRFVKKIRKSTSVERRIKTLESYAQMCEKELVLFIQLGHHDLHTLAAANEFQVDEILSTGLILPLKSLRVGEQEIPWRVRESRILDNVYIAFFAADSYPEGKSYVVSSYPLS